MHTQPCRALAVTLWRPTSTVRPMGKRVAARGEVLLERRCAEKRGWGFIPSRLFMLTCIGESLIQVISSVSTQNPISLLYLHHHTTSSSSSTTVTTATSSFSIATITTIITTTNSALRVPASHGTVQRRRRQSSWRCVGSQCWYENVILLLAWCVSAQCMSACQHACTESVHAHDGF